VLAVPTCPFCNPFGDKSKAFGRIFDKSFVLGSLFLVSSSSLFAFPGGKSARSSSNFVSNFTGDIFMCTFSKDDFEDVGSLFAASSSSGFDEVLAFVVVSTTRVAAAVAAERFLSSVAGDDARARLSTKSTEKKCVLPRRSHIF
jgi:hypothetical protein